MEFFYLWQLKHFSRFLVVCEILMTTRSSNTFMRARNFRTRNSCFAREYKSSKPMRPTTQRIVCVFSQHMPTSSKIYRILKYSSIFLPCFSIDIHTGLGRKERITVLPNTVYIIYIINRVSQDNYFWRSLYGGNLFESSSFILCFTVLPFPAGRQEKWNHMFGGAI